MSSAQSTSDGERSPATFNFSPKQPEAEQQQLQQQQQQQRELQVSCQEEPPLESHQLSQSIGEDLRPRLQRRNQFIFARKTALSMDQCPVVWNQAPSPQAIHSHSGSDTGLLLGAGVSKSSRVIAQSMECVQKRRSVTDSPHLRVLHDSLTSLTNRITGGGSQENLPDQQQQQQQQQQQLQSSSGTGSPTASSASLSPSVQHHQLGKSNRSRRKMKDSRDKLADSLRLCEVGGLPKPENLHQQLESLCLELDTSLDRVLTADLGATSAKTLKQQAAIMELLQTEANILRHLKTIIEVYVTVIKHLQSSCGLLTDISTELLFPGISEVFQAHYTLWSEHLRPALSEARQEAGGRLRPTRFYRGFAEFRTVFQPSAEYCMRIAEAKEYLKSLEKNESFSDFVRWAQKVSQRNYSLEDQAVDLQLASLLTMPLQRVMKYGLLLQEILRHTDDGEERLALETMIGHVTAFCNELNATYRTKCDQADLRVVSERIEDAKLQEWMESLGDETAGFLESYRLNLMRPMPHNGQHRRKLAEGDLRCKDEKGKWAEVRCLLFTDLLLLTKCSKRSSLRLLKPPLRLDRLVVHRLSENYSFLLVALTDFGSVDSLLCLACDSQKAADDWTERVGQSKAALLAQMRENCVGRGGGGGGSLYGAGCDGAVNLQLQPQNQQQQSACAAVQDQQQIRLRHHAATGGGGLGHYTRSSCDMDSLQHQHQRQHAVQVELPLPDGDISSTTSSLLSQPLRLQEPEECNRRSSHV